MAAFEITEARLASLPKWARQEITRLRRNEEHHVATLTAGPEDSDTFADPYIHPRPLGRGTVIEFRLGDGWENRFRATIVRQNNGDPALAVSNGGMGIAVLPDASNSITVVPRQR